MQTFDHLYPKPAGLFRMPRTIRRVQGVSRLAEHMVAGTKMCAPAPPTSLEKYAALAERYGLVWDARTPAHLENSLRMVKAFIANQLQAVGYMPDGDPRDKDNDADDDGGDNPEVTQGKDSGDDEE